MPNLKHGSDAVHTSPQAADPIAAHEVAQGTAFAIHRPTWAGGPDLSVPAAFTGVGSRETPHEVLDLMRAAGARLALWGWTLRSGDAPGADTAFEEGVDQIGPSANKQVFLPWSGFNGRRPDGVTTFLVPPDLYAEAQAIAKTHHPAWFRLTQGGRRLQTRNVTQVLGPMLDSPSAFVLCWTPGGSGSGGTGEAIRIAKSRGIAVYDLGDPDIRAAVTTWLRQGDGTPTP